MLNMMSRLPNVQDLQLNAALMGVVAQGKSRFPGLPGTAHVSLSLLSTTNSEALSSCRALHPCIGLQAWECQAMARMSCFRTPPACEFCGQAITSTCQPHCPYIKCMLYGLWLRACQDVRSCYYSREVHLCQHANDYAMPVPGLCIQKPAMLCKLPTESSVYNCNTRSSLTA